MGQRGIPHRLEDPSSLLQMTTPKPIYAAVSLARISHHLTVEARNRPATR